MRILKNLKIAFLLRRINVLCVLINKNGRQDDYVHIGNRANLNRALNTYSVRVNILLNELYPEIKQLRDEMLAKVEAAKMPEEKVAEAMKPLT